MRYFIIALMLFSFVIGCSGEGYDATILEYRIKIYSLNSMPDTIGFFNYTIENDTTLTATWQSDTINAPAWTSPNARTIHDIIYIQNQPQIWDGITAQAQIFLTLNKNTWYELTATAYGDETYITRESDEARPVYIWVPPSGRPRVLTELRLF